MCPTQGHLWVLPAGLWSPDKEGQPFIQPSVIQQQQTQLCVIIVMLGEKPP